MSSKTINFELHKIDLADAPPDITVLNANWDTIDTQMANIVKYYDASTNQSADDLVVPLALIPLSSTVNSGLYAILGGSFAYVETIFYGAASVTNRRRQLAWSYNSGYSQMAMRVYSSNGWLAWVKIADANDLDDLDFEPDLSGVVSKAGDTMYGALRIKNTADATSGIRLNSTSNTGAVLIDQSVITDDDSDRSGIKITHNSDTINEMAQLFRTVDGTTNWYPLYGKHNAFLSCKLYSSLSEIGLTTGSETISDIANNLPNNSILVVSITANNASGIYPSNYGLLTVKRSSGTRIEFEFVTTAGVAYKGFYSITSSGDSWSSWNKVWMATDILSSTTDLTAGTSSLATGKIYLVYE